MKSPETSSNISLTDLVDYVFPYEKLCKWSHEIALEHPRPPRDIMGKVAKITTDKNFWGKNPLLSGEPLTIQRPSDGSRIVLMEHGVFYTSRLIHLEDKELNRVMTGVYPAGEKEVPLGQVNTTMRFATLLIGMLTENYCLSESQVVEVAKLHCVLRTAYDYPSLAGSPEDQAFLLYACTKIIAQKIELGQTASAHRVDFYPS